MTPTPTWQRITRLLTACMLGLGLCAAVASVVFHAVRPDPSQEQLQQAAQVLIPDAQLEPDEVLGVDSSGLGPNVRRAGFEPRADLGAVEEAVIAAEAPRAMPDSDEFVADLGPILAKVQPTQLQVVVDDRLPALLLTAVAGLAGALVFSARSWRRSGRTPAASTSRRRVITAGLFLPLGLMLALGWLVVLASLAQLRFPTDFGSMGLGVAVLLFFVWMPIGVVIAILVGVFSGRPTAR
ncbi:MAG: hypothetical protein ACR2HR_00085 [Euzebya sp.]